MKTSKEANKAAIIQAITRSISHNESVDVEIAAENIADVTTEIFCLDDGLDCDYAQENDQTYDVWSTAGEEWRLNVTLIRS